jgi:tetraacyldisaccharide 4'-kinase
MRAIIERVLRRGWSGQLGPSGAALMALVTAPLSWVWAGALAVRGRSWRGRAPRRAEGVHVVSIGNLAVGGTGKTPLVAWVAERLERDGRAVAIVVGNAGGDEALLYRRWRVGRPVFVESDREAGVLRARAEGAGVVVLDDAFQHRGLARDVDVVLLSADDPFPGALLPRGPYREPARSLARADAIVVTRREATLEEARAVAARAEDHAKGKVAAAARIVPYGWARLDAFEVEGTPGPELGRDVVAVCGIARPDAFRRRVAELLGGAVELVCFADHHAYAHEDVVRLKARAAGRPVVVTEKDAAKLAAWRVELSECWVLLEEVRWDWGEEQLVARLVPVSA